MDGNEEAEMTFLKEHFKLFADQIRTSEYSKNAALYMCNSSFMKTMYNSSFMKTMEYAMPVTKFWGIEWNRIVAPALESSLQKAGMSKNSRTASFVAQTYIKDSR